MENPQKTLIVELQSMIQTFLAHEEKTLSEAPAEFHVLLQETLRDVVSSIFMSEVQKISDIRDEIQQISQSMEEKQVELSEKLSGFLTDVTEITATPKSQKLCPEFNSLKTALSQTIIELSTAKSSLKKTARKGEGKQLFGEGETPKEKSAIFGKKPRAACVIFMERRMEEMFPEGAGVEEYRENLKGLMQEWKGLKEDERREFEILAESELLEYFQL